MKDAEKPIPVLRHLVTSCVAGLLIAWLILTCAGCKLYVCDTTPASPGAPANP